MSIAGQQVTRFGMIMIWPWFGCDFKVYTESTELRKLLLGWTGVRRHSTYYVHQRGPRCLGWDLIIPAKFQRRFQLCLKPSQSRAVVDNNLHEGEIEKLEAQETSPAPTQNRAGQAKISLQRPSLQNQHSRKNLQGQGSMIPVPGDNENSTQGNK